MSAKAAATIFERHHVGVFRYFGRMTGRHDLAQDLTQEVFLRIVRGLEAYQEQGLETAWVFRIARNVYLDYRRRTGSVPPTIHEVEDVSADCQNLAAFRLQEALALLPEREREVFVLRETEGLTYSEIGAACEATEQNVRTLLRHARLRLRALLSQRLSQPPSIHARNGKP